MLMRSSIQNAKCKMQKRTSLWRHRDALLRRSDREMGSGVIFSRITQMTPAPISRSDPLCSAERFDAFDLRQLHREEPIQQHRIDQSDGREHQKREVALDEVQLFDERREAEA